MDNTFYKPTLEDVVFTTDDYIIGKNFEAKYWKCFSIDIDRLLNPNQ